MCFVPGCVLTVDGWLLSYLYVTPPLGIILGCASIPPGARSCWQLIKMTGIEENYDVEVCMCLCVCVYVCVCVCECGSSARV